jgi:peptide/nickel transport system substrate-binding protein
MTGILTPPSRRTLLTGFGSLALLPGVGFNNRSAWAAGNTLDPGKASLIPEYYVIWSVYNGLLTFDDKMKIVPDLAESYATTPDGGLEFKLRSGVKFHDGSAFTADDVKFSLERILDPKFASPNRSKVAEIDRIEILDPLTLRIYTKRPFAPLLTFLTNTRTGTQIVPKAAVQQMGDEAFARRPIGTGAYKVASWQAGQALVLEAHEGYFGGAARIKTVNVPLIPEESSGVTALLGGQIDLTSTAPFADIPQLSSNKAIKVAKQPGLNTRFISLNLRKAPFDDVHFRRAVSMAFQREAMVNAVLFGEGVVTHGVIPPTLGDYFSAAPREVTTFDPKRAKEEFAKSKYAANPPAVAVVTWGAGWWKRIAEIFVAQVNATLGTKFTVEVTDPNAAYARQKSGDFVASVWGWLGMVDPDEYISDIFHSTGWRNFGGYTNPEADKLIMAGAGEMDPAKRGAIYRQAEALIMEDAPVIPCFCSNIHNLTSARVSGFVQKPYSNFGDQFTNLQLS